MTANLINTKACKTADTYMTVISNEIAKVGQFVTVADVRTDCIILRIARPARTIHNDTLIAIAEKGASDVTPHQIAVLARNVERKQQGAFEYAKITR